MAHLQAYQNNKASKKYVLTPFARKLKRAAQAKRVKENSEGKTQGLKSYKDLWDHQLQHFKFIWKRECAALFLDMGLGKTAIVLTWIAALIIKRRITKPVLLVGPIRVIYGVWAQEAQEWRHLRNLRFSIVHGTEAQRLEALDAHADVYMINPESLVWLLRLFRSRRARLNWPFEVLVIDESSMFKSAGAKRFRTLRHFAPLFTYRTVLSGTPRPNSLLEIWTQIFIIDLGKRLGESYERFRDRFAKPDYDGSGRYTMRKTAPARINSLIKDIAVTMRLSDWRTDTPPTLINPVYIDLPPAARTLYDKFEKELFLKLDRGDVRAFNAATLTGKCQQIANGAIYSIERDTDSRIWELVHDAKMEALRDIVNETGGPLLVAYWFKPDQYRLRTAFPKAPVFNQQNLDTLEDEWNNNEHDIALAHPLTVAYGANLQKGLGCTIAWFSMTWSFEKFTQFNARIGGARARRPVMVHQIIARNTTDEAMQASLKFKGEGNADFMTALNTYRRKRAA